MREPCGRSCNGRGRRGAARQARKAGRRRRRNCRKEQSVQPFNRNARRQCQPPDARAGRTYRSQAAPSPSCHGLADTELVDVQLGDLPRRRGGGNSRRRAVIAAHRRVVKIFSQGPIHPTMALTRSRSARLKTLGHEKHDQPGTSATFRGFNPRQIPFDPPPPCSPFGAVSAETTANPQGATLVVCTGLRRMHVVAGAHISCGRRPFHHRTRRLRRSCRTSSPHAAVQPELATRRALFNAARLRELVRRSPSSPAPIRQARSRPFYFTRAMGTFALASHLHASVRPGKKMNFARSS